MLHHHLFVVAVEYASGPLIGIIGGMSAPHLFNPVINVLTEIFWWVAPQHRGTSVGMRLLQYYLDEGQRKSDWIVLTLEHKTPVSDRVLLKHGFKPYERSYLMEVQR